MIDNTPYHKISGPLKRATEGPDKNQVIPGNWSEDYFEALQDAQWTWTEKIDGTNIRVYWDGYRIRFGGRTEKAVIPPKLLDHLNEEFREELLEQKFAGQPTTLYGEGFGAGIQKGGGSYIPDGVGFILFDVHIHDHWLSPLNVSQVGESLGVDTVYGYGPPPVFTLNQAMEYVGKGWHSNYREGYAEGLIGQPVGGFLNRKGGRIITKVKHVDFFEAN